MSDTKSAAEQGALSVEIDAQGVAVITYDVPGASMNTLRKDFVDAFSAVFDEIASNDAIRAAVLISGKKDSFIAGADIDMLSEIDDADAAEEMCRKGHEAIAKLAQSSKPVVAAIHGAALGGGFEVALACQGRVLSQSRKTVLGLPEVKLGLLPGLNGLQRLAGLTSVQVALDYGLTGKNMRPKTALKLGVADDVVPRPILKQVAIERALALAAGETPKKKIGIDRDELMQFALEKNPLGRSLLFKKARETLQKKTGGHYPAPFRIVDVLETYAQSGFDKSKAAEARAFGELLQSDVSKSLMGLFFATTAMKKDTGVDDEGVAPNRVDRLAMIGAGLMGAGIASVSLDNGIAVRLKDRDSASIGRGIKYINDILDTKVKRRYITSAERAEVLSRLSTTTDYSGMKSVELVIEAVFEDLELKQQVLRDVEASCAPGAIFASNTSSIPIKKIAAASKHPENVVGMHYFSPVHKMPLLEVIRTDETAPEVVATAVEIGKRQGKTVIVVRDGVGFYTSRVLGPYMNEASYLLTEGLKIDTIDRAMTQFGWPVGPLTLADEVGLDVAAHVGPIMRAEFGERMTPPSTSGNLVEDGRKGRKNNKGFYLYGKAAKKRGKGKHVDETVYGVLGLDTPSYDRSPIPIEQIQERCNLQFINEALHCYGEGLLRSPRDGDIGAIFGLGFPPYLGGPFRHVDALGADHVLSRIEHYQERFGVRWGPAPALVEMAKSGKRFYPR
jgi:3-hydroxyacyl-CoA dehydrogenase/enoyl-CoA hydratase/3-hydroxybutyryl-CoA epimerase